MSKINNAVCYNSYIERTSLEQSNTMKSSDQETTSTMVDKQMPRKSKFLEKKN